MLSSRDSSLVMMETRRAKRERNSAACPAEFPPPRTYTSWSRHAAASAVTAP